MVRIGAVKGARRVVLPKAPDGRWRGKRPRSVTGGIMANEERSDQPVRRHIERLVKEEHTLYDKGGLSEADQRRLNELRSELDQCWDLLRQRRALREFGKDPDKAHVRSKKTVESYEQ
jgi:uncharacterized protein DUF2630